MIIPLKNRSKVASFPPYCRKPRFFHLTADDEDDDDDDDDDDDLETPTDFSIRVDRSVEPYGIPDRLFDSSRSIDRALRDPRSTFRFESIDRAIGDPRKRVEVGPRMRQPFQALSLFDGLLPI